MDLIKKMNNYRLLKDEEIIKENDEFFNFGVWNNMKKMSPSTIGRIFFRNQFVGMRRKINLDKKESSQNQEIWEKV
jgi:hypothetical protein